MENMIHKLDLKDRVLIHLNDVKHKDEIKQNGKENLLKEPFIDEKGYDDIINTLLEKEYIKYKNKKEDSIDYSLTDKGVEKYKKIWDEIKDSKFILSDNKDSIELSLSEISRISDNKSMINIFNSISKKGVIDLDKKTEKSDELVGRNEELEKLESSVEELKNSNGTTHFILGSTGIGKTRLAVEIKNMANSKNIDFIRGRCSIEEYRPYKPFKEALNKFIKCGRKIDEKRNMVVDSKEKNIDVENKEMFDALKKSTFFETTQYVKKLSSKRPLVIFLDDLQWADKGSLNLLDYMTERLQDEPVLFLCTYRPGDVPNKHPLKETIRRMSRKRTFNKIKLDPLEKDDVSVFIEKITGIHDIPGSFVEYMLEKTNGNPLFIKESIKQMLEEEMIDKEQGKFPDSSDIILVPDLIEEVIERRIVNFDDNTRKILQLGSVIGKKVPFELLVEASEMDELELLDHIDTLIDTNIWFEESQDEAFCFSHDLIVDTIYNGTGRWLERKKIHRQVGKALEELYEDKLENKYSSLAYHYKEGEEFCKSFKYYLESGKQAENVYANEDAIEKYTEALKLSNKIDNLSDEDIFESMERLGDAYSIIGDYKDSRENLKQALAKASDGEKKRRIYRKIAQTWVDQGEYEKTISIIKNGLNIKEDTTSDEDKLQESPETCKLLSEKGWVKRRQGKHEESYKIFKKELEMAEKLENKKPLSQAYHDLGTSARSVRDYEESIEYLREAVRIKEEIGDEKGLSRSFNNLGVTYYQKGKYDDSLKYFEKSYEIDKKIGRKIGLGRSLHNIGLLYQNMGKLDRSEEYYKRSIEIKKKIGDKQGISRVENSVGLLEKERGDFSKAIKHLNNCIEIAKKIEDYYSESMGYHNLAEIYILKGELNRALELTDKSFEIANEINNDVRKIQSLDNYGLISRFEGKIERSIKKHEEAINKALNLNYKLGLMENRLNLAETYMFIDDLEKAEKQIEEVEKEDFDGPYLRTRKEMIKGILQRKSGNLEKSITSLKDSLEETKQICKKYREVRLYYELGISKKKLGNYLESKEYLDKSLNMAKKIGMKTFKKKSKMSLEDIKDD